MSTPGIVPALFMFTLVAVALIAVVGYLLFIRKRGNRHPVEEPSKKGQTMAPDHDPSR